MAELLRRYRTKNMANPSSRNNIFWCVKAKMSCRSDKTEVGCGWVPEGKRRRAWSRLWLELGLREGLSFFQCGDLIHTYELNANVSVRFCTTEFLHGDAFCGCLSFMIRASRFCYTVSKREISLRKAIINNLNSFDKEQLSVSIPATKKSTHKIQDIDIAIIITDAYYIACQLRSTQVFVI